jgi:hypothetical protein
MKVAWQDNSSRGQRIFLLTFRNSWVEFRGLNWNLSFTIGQNGFNWCLITTEAISTSKSSLMTICSSSAPIGLWPLLIDTR